MKNNPEIINWRGMRIIRISDIGKDFSEWLNGQTVPFVEDNENPTDWAYIWDYIRFVRNLPVVD